MSRRNDRDLYWHGEELWIGDQKIEKSPRPAGSSRGATPPSVISAYQTKDARPPPVEIGSYPPLTEPSSTRYRYIHGYPETLYGGASQGSAPIHPAAKNDRFRYAMNEKRPYNHGYPKHSPFKRLYNEGKDRDAAALSVLDCEYRPHLATAPRVTQKIAAKNPGVYAGELRATRKWHEEAADIAQRGSETYKEAAELRTKLSHDFIGYGTQDSAQRHTRRARDLFKTSGRLEKKARDHRSSHTDC